MVYTPGSRTNNSSALGPSTRPTFSPLIIGTDHRDGGSTLRISSNPAEIPQRCCIIAREGNEVILVNEWPAGTLVNDRVILQTSALELGQTIRVGTQSHELKLIACVDR